VASQDPEEIEHFSVMSLLQNPEFAQSDLDPERRLPAGLVAFPSGRLEAGAPQTLHDFGRQGIGQTKTAECPYFCQRLLCVALPFPQKRGIFCNLEQVTKRLRTTPGACHCEERIDVAIHKAVWIATSLRSSQ
jgi:hypothetical protein